MTVPTTAARRHLVWWVPLVLLLSACQVRTATGIDVRADGSGRVEVVVALDDELTGMLDEAAVDPFEGLELLPAPWSSARETIDGGAALRVGADFATPAELTERVDDLNDGLDEGDPAVLEDVALTVGADGSTTFTAMAGLRPPDSTGIQAQGLAPDGDALRALLEEAGQELVRVEVRLSLPGDVRVATGGPDDRRVVDGRTVVWDLDPTGLVAIAAEGDPGRDFTLWYAIGAAVLGVALGAGALTLRRR